MNEVVGPVVVLSVELVLVLSVLVLSVTPVVEVRSRHSWTTAMDAERFPGQLPEK